MLSPQNLKLPLTAFSLCLLAAQMQAVPIFSPSNTIFGVRNNGAGMFEVAVVGTDGGGAVYTDNFFPSNEPPFDAIDNTGDKYLNFAELNTGIVVTAASAQIARALMLHTANDGPVRDPSSFQIYGTNVSLGGGPFSISDFALIASGPLALPVDRNPQGSALTGTSFMQTVTFPNSVAYTSYAIIFPTVKDEPGSNSMQIAEVQLDTVPEPGSALLLGFAGVAFAARRRRQ
jgi:hypothetical protein